MSTVGTISRRTPLTGTNNPAYQVSKTVANDSLMVASAAANGSVMVRDSANPDGWGFLAQIPAATVDLTTFVADASHGGTGLTSHAVGILHWSGLGGYAELAPGASGTVLKSDGAGVAPSYGAVSLSVGSPGISGALAVANGGTGIVTYTIGDLLVAGSASALSKLAAPAVGYVLASAGVGVAPQWSPFLTLASYLEGTEIAAPAAPAANGGRLFYQDNGSGKTQLMCIFATGAAQQVAIQP